MPRPTADTTAPPFSRTDPKHRTQRAKLLKRLDRLAERIEPDHFDRALSGKIDVVLAQLDALDEGDRR